MPEKIKIKEGECKVIDIPPSNACIDIEIEGNNEIIRLCNEDGNIIIREIKKN